jgi:hypothetical protein
MRLVCDIKSTSYQLGGWASLIFGNLFKNKVLKAIQTHNQ